MDSFGTASLGIYLDVGNLLGYHQYPPHWIEILGERIRRIHVKDFKQDVGNLDGFCDLGHGDVPWNATFEALDAIGYDATIVAEMMPWRPGLLVDTNKAMNKIMFKQTVSENQ